MRRRAEVELEYSRGLDKLVERFSGRGGRLGGGSREHQSFRWVLGPGSWDGRARGPLLVGLSPHLHPPPIPRKEPSLLSPLHCWAVLLQQTRQQSRESTALSEVLGGPLAQRLSYIAEDVGRLVKKARLLPWAWEAGRPQDPARAACGCSKPKCQGREGPGGWGELVGAWSAELRAGGMDVGVALEQGGTQLASSPE